MRYLLAFVLMMAAQAWAVTGTLSADGDTSAVNLPMPHVHLSGSFGGGTVTCSIADDTGAYTPLDGATFTAAADVTIDIARPAPVKCTLSGSAGPALKWIIR